MEAAGIEPGKFDEPDAVSRRHQRCAIWRGRQEAGVRYLARQAAISPVAWTNGTKAVQHRTRLEGIPRLRARRALSGAGEARGPTG